MQVPCSLRLTNLQMSTGIVLVCLCHFCIFIMLRQCHLHEEVLNVASGCEFVTCFSCDKS